MTETIDPRLIEAIDRLVEGMANFTNQQANIELRDRWPRIWGIAQSGGLTKIEAYNLAWRRFKTIRRAARDERRSRAVSDISDR